jgi:predicted PurR-regulated permease PerM
MSDEPTTVQRFWRLSLLILASIFALWLAVQLISQVWGWLLVAVVIAGLVTIMVLWLRRRRDKW